MNSIDPFEDIRREYANRYSETNGILLANSYDSFVHKMLSAIQVTLNNTEPGRKLTDDLYGISLRKGQTPDQWQHEKVKIMQVLFFLTLDSCPALKHEMAIHLYNELRKEVSA